MSAHRALEIFRANPVDLVLTEHVLPAIIGGPALAATMKMLNPEVPVAVLSADLWEWPEDKRFADIFITKLVSVDELLREGEKLLPKVEPSPADLIVPTTSRRTRPSGWI